MSISPSLNDLSKLALVASDSSYFTSTHPVLPGSPLAPLDEGDPTILPRFDFSAGFIEFRQFPDPSSIPTGFKAIAYERNTPGNPKEVILAFGGSDGGPLANPTDWVSNTQHLGWNQWDANRDQIFEYLNGLPPDTKITFTGQSLGGALAQYAAYEWIKSKTAADPGFDKGRISLITFNAFGGYLAFNDPTKGGGYSASVLTGINADLSAHYVITGDLVSRLGGDPTAGIGHVGGQMYLLDYRTVNPDTGEVVKLDLIEGHRIETGFYAGLHTLDAFTVAQNLFSTTTPQQWYLPMASLQNTAGLLGNILNGRDVGRAESVPRLLAGLMAGMTFGNQQEWDTLIKAYLTNQQEAGKISLTDYAFYHGTTMPLAVVGKPAETAIYAASVILAGIADALGLGLDAIQKGFRFLKEFLQVSTGPAEPVGVSQGEFAQDAALILAATGSFSNSNPLRQEFLAHNLNPDEFAQHLLTVSDPAWRTDTLAYLRDQLPNPADKVQVNGLAVAFYDTLSTTPDLDPSDLTLFAQERNALILDTGSGFANAMADFTQKITNVAFNLGQTISNFADIQLIDQAYAAELDDPRLSSSVKAVIEDAREIVQHAGQTVVVQQWIGPNPFTTPGFDPATAPVATGTVKEKQVKTFTAYLPFEAGTGGQAVQLNLQGVGTSTVTVLSNGQEFTPVNGLVTLVIAEGQKAIQFALRAQDLASDATVSIIAQLVELVNGTPVATHQAHQEATITAVNTPTINYANGLSGQVWNGSAGDDVRDLLGAFNYEAHGNGGNDLIFSRAGNDQLYGDAGNDSLYGFVGHDQLTGGTGRDLLIADFRDDYIPPSGAVAGQDVVDGGAEDDVVAGGGGDDQLVGGTGKDHLWGDNLVEGDSAQPGDPGSGLRATYFFRAANIPGNDELDGGDGDDLLLGNLGDDVLLGGAGADKLFGDQVPGDSGAPVSFLETNGGADFLDGGDGTDLLQGDGGDDVLWGGAGDDQLYGDDRVTDAVTPGDDWLEGGIGDDLLVGGAGDDLLDGGADNDQLFGQEGADVLNGGDGVDQLSGGIGSDDLYGGVGDDILAGHDGSDTLLGEDGADQLDGGADNDQLVGGTGNDVLFGQAGDDYLDGEENDDELRGGDGKDELVGDAGIDRLFGDAGADTLSGDEGVDYLTGGTGNDVLDGGAGSDTYVFDLGDGQDVIFESDNLADLNTISFVSPPVPPGYEGPPLGITPNMLTFTPNEAEHTLLIQVGTGGDSILINGFTNTGVNGTGGIQNIVVGGVSYLLGDSVGLPSGQISGTSSNDVIRTGSGDDIIQAGLGNDDVSSNAGNDLLVGGRGNDQLSGGTGQDIYRFNIGDGSDLILDANGENNKLIFGTGIALQDLLLEVGVAGSLIIHNGATSDQIQIASFNPLTLSGSHPVDSFEFADGTVLTYSELAQRGFTFYALQNQGTTINGSGFNDLIIGGPYNDFLNGGGGDDRLDGNGGADILIGSSGHDTMDGNDGDDELFGGSGTDTLLGGTGDDYIMGNGEGSSREASNDYFDGGPGNDRLIGDDWWSNTYVFRRGGGQDVIGNFDSRNRDIDTLKFLDLLPTDITVQEEYLGESLYRTGNLNLLVNGSTDRVTLGDWIELYDSATVYDPYFVMERIEFADGTVWSTADLIAHGQGLSRIGTELDDQGSGARLDGTVFDDVLIGLAGNDELTGFKGNDFIDGGPGNDFLEGDTGSDTYAFGKGYGSDWIGEDLYRSRYWGMSKPGDVDTVRLTTNVASSEVQFSIDFTDTLTLTIVGTEDRLTIENSFDGFYEIERFVFADGTVWDETTLQAMVAGLEVMGTEGNDYLLGTPLSDTLTGLAGADILEGGGGPDHLNGGSGDDTYVFYRDGGAVTIADKSVAGELNRVLFQHELTAADLVVSQGNGTLTLAVDGTSHQIIFNGFDLAGVEGSAVVSELLFEDGLRLSTADFVAGQLTDGDDVVLGTADDDVIVGRAGNDSLNGGAGNDTLIGSGGQDTYRFNLGDGVDTICDRLNEFNRLSFGPGITPDSLDLTVQRGGLKPLEGSSVLFSFYESDMLVLKVGMDGEAVQLTQFQVDNPYGPHSIDRFEFADGTVLSYGQLIDRGFTIRGTDTDDTLDGIYTSVPYRLMGEGGNDYLTGSNQNDILIGGAGNDSLEGSFGNDTYFFKLGDGQDIIRDGGAYVNPLESNQILFGAGISVTDIHFDREGYGLVLSVGTGGDSVTLPNFEWEYTVQTLGFADGGTLDIANLFATPVGTTASETLTGTSGNDLLIGGGGDDLLFGGLGNDTLIVGQGNSTIDGGAGDDRLIGGSGTSVLHGGLGNDTLIGGSGENSYVFSLGDGQDTILVTNYTSAHSLNVVQFAGGYDNYNPQLDLGSLVIRYGTMGDEIHIVDFDPTDVFAPPAIQQFVFTGRTLTYAEFISLGFDLMGTAGNDSLTGTNTTDRFLGLAGDDQISGGAGTDTFTGGLGNDTLRGGAGHDTYVFDLGDGNDTIEDIAAAGEGNRVRFGTGISQSALTFARDTTAQTLTIQVGSSGTDQLRLLNFDPTGTTGSLVVQTLAFADGNVVNLVDLFPSNHAPTVATPLADQTVAEDVPFSLMVPANTFTGADVGDGLTLSATLADGTAFPSWLTFDATTATFSGAPDDAQVGSLNLKVTATDQENERFSDIFTLTVANINEAPTVPAPIADHTAIEDTAFSFAVPASTIADEDHVHGDTLTYQATRADGTALLPTWLSFDPITRTFSGTPGNADVGTVALTVTATDTEHLSASDTFDLTVTNVNDAPTVATPIADQTAAEDSAFALTVPSDTFVDQDHIHGDVLTYSATLANGSPFPAWLSFNPNSQMFSGTPGAGDAGSLQIAVTATDSGNLSTTDLFTLAVSGPLPQTVIGTAGNDVLTGWRGDDTLLGLAGHDTLDGGLGSDTMLGGAGNDRYLVDASGDGVTELANDGFDTVLSAVTYTLSANVEALVLTGSNAINGTGNSLTNGLTGNQAANVLDGGTGADVMAGLEGDDTYIVDTSSDLVVEVTNQGNDTVHSRITYTLGINVENLILTGTTAINGTGNSLNNRLTGNSAANTLAGGAGNDTYVVSTGDTVVESSNSGADTVQSAVSWTLGSNLEQLTLTGVATINGTGNGAANILTGNSAHNVLSGAGGNDMLRGGLGRDTVNGGSGNDTFLFGRGEGQDLVQDNSGAADTMLYDAGITPLDLVLSRQANDLRLAIHGSADSVTVQNWYSSASNRTETIQAGNGQTLLSTQVDQLIQAMAGFTAQTGLTWDQAIDQQPTQVETILAASWQ